MRNSRQFYADEVIKDGYLPLFFLSFVSLFISILTSFSYAPSLIAVILQDVLLICMLVSGKIELFTSLYVIFLATSFETTAHLSDVDASYYGFKNIRFFGLSNNLVILLIATVIYFLIYNKRIIRLQKSGPEAPMSRMLLLDAIAIAVGFLCILFGDNGASLDSDYIRIYINEVYYGVNTLLTLLFIYASFKTSNNIRRTSNLFINTVLGIILAECYVPYVGYYMDIMGDYGGSLVTTFAKLLVPLLLLFASYYPLKHKWFLYVSFVIGEILPIILFKAGSGKEVLFLLLSLVFMVFFKMTRNQGKSNRRYIFIMFCIIGIGLLYFALPILIDMNIMISAKAKQLYSLISFSNTSNYLTDMESSPQVRIYEVLSVLKEYATKPWSIPFGKGFGGSFQDHFGFFTSLPSYMWSGKFSDFEFINNYFYRMHELSRIPLTYGVLGIVSVISWVKSMLSHNSPMALLGIIWVVLFINNSQTLACVLMLGFVTAMYQDEIFDTNL